jgi:hypothetical protein
VLDLGGYAGRAQASVSVLTPEESRSEPEPKGRRRRQTRPADRAQGQPLGRMCFRRRTGQMRSGRRRRGVLAGGEAILIFLVVVVTEIPRVPRRVRNSAATDRLA